MRVDKKRWGDKEQGGRPASTHQPYIHHTLRASSFKHAGEPCQQERASPVARQLLASVHACVETVVHLLQLGVICRVYPHVCRVRMCVCVCSAIKKKKRSGIAVQRHPAQLCLFGCHPHWNTTAASIHSTASFLFFPYSSSSTFCLPHLLLLFMFDKSAAG